MISNCLISSRVGDRIRYRHRFGVEAVTKEIVTKRYVGPLFSAQAGLYPAVLSPFGERIIHPEVYVVHKIYRKPNIGHAIW
jgi:hypothetical protein